MYAKYDLWKISPSYGVWRSDEQMDEWINKRVRRALIRSPECHCLYYILKDYDTSL